MRNPDHRRFTNARNFLESGLHLGWVMMISLILLTRDQSRTSCLFAA